MSEGETDRKRPGRPRLAPGDGPSDGQPRITVRVPAEVAEWLKTLPGGLKELVMEQYRWVGPGKDQTPAIFSAENSPSPARRSGKIADMPEAYALWEKALAANPDPAKQ